MEDFSPNSSHQDDGEDVQQGTAQAAGKGLPASPKMEEMVSHGRPGHPPTTTNTSGSPSPTGRA